MPGHPQSRRDFPLTPEHKITKIGKLPPPTGPTEPPHLQKPRGSFNDTYWRLKQPSREVFGEELGEEQEGAKYMGQLLLLARAHQDPVPLTKLGSAP